MALFFAFMWSNQLWKDTWIVELLKSREELCTHMPKKLIWIYGVEQPDLFKTIKEIWAPHQCEFVEGFPEDLMSRLEKNKRSWKFMHFR